MKNDTFTLLGVLVGAGLGMGVAYAIKRDKAIGALLGAVAGFGAGYLRGNWIMNDPAARKDGRITISTPEEAAAAAAIIERVRTLPERLPGEARLPTLGALGAGYQMHRLGSYFRAPQWRAAS